MLDRSKLWAAALLLAVFAAGAVTGGAVTSAWGGGDGPDESRRATRDDRSRHNGGYAERLEADLGLSQDQRSSVDTIMALQQVQVRELWAEYRPRFDTLRQDVRRQIMEILSDEQQQKYQELIDRSDRSRRDRESERDRN